MLTDPTQYSGCLVVADNLCRQGDIVEIGTCRPISKKKRFYLTRIIKAMPQ